MQRTLLMILAAALAAPAQHAPMVSPEVDAGHRATFRFRDPNAKEVYVIREGAKRLPMQRDENGTWSVTTDPLEPDFYGYFFVADGVNLIDPLNPLLKPSLLLTQSMLHVSGGGLPWELADVPHGAVDHHFYKSAVVGDDRDFYVYTPPGYDPAGGRLYPVLYLLHGYSDGADGWTATGRAHVILDNLIAQGKAKPMLVVMPLGYGAPEVVQRSGPPVHDAGLWQKNMSRFREALFTEVMPQVEKSYRAAKGRDERAIAGLSMGGAESLDTGLNSLERFAWIGAFSSGGLSDDFDAEFRGLDAKANAQLRLLWIACGTDDHLLELNQKFRAWLTAKGVRHTDVETPGAHAWMVWRRNLASFAGLVFGGGQ